MRKRTRKFAGPNSFHPADQFTGVGFAPGGGGFSPRSATAAWSPLELSPSLWLKSDTGLSLSGTDVTAWADQSGNGRNLTGTAARYPSKVASQTVGTLVTDVVDSNGGIDGQMTGTIPVPTNGTVVIVARTTIVGKISYNSLMWDGPATATVPGIMIQHDTSDRPAIAWNSAERNPGPESLVDSAYHAARWMWGASNLSYARDNAADTTAARGGLTASGNWTQFFSVVGTVFNTYSRFAEIIVFPSELTAGQITSLNSYLQARYGLW